jgi:hypothetical protein
MEISLKKLSCIPEDIRLKNAEIQTQNLPECKTHLFIQIPRPSLTIRKMGMAHILLILHLNFYEFTKQLCEEDMMILISSFRSLQNYGQQLCGSTSSADDNTKAQPE